jgi:hypothetical protein
MHAPAFKQYSTTHHLLKHWLCWVRTASFCGVTTASSLGSLQPSWSTHLPNPPYTTYIAEIEGVKSEHGWVCCYWMLHSVKQPRAWQKANCWRTFRWLLIDRCSSVGSRMPIGVEWDIWAMKTSCLGNSCTLKAGIVSYAWIDCRYSMYSRIRSRTPSYSS